MKIWTCRSSPQIVSWNAWTRNKNVNGRSNFWNFFSAIQMISCRNWWPWTKPGYITMSKQHSTEWRHKGSPRPKKFRVQKSAGKFLASIFWDQDGILLIDYLSKGQKYSINPATPKKGHSRYPWTEAWKASFVCFSTSLKWRLKHMKLDFCILFLLMWNLVFHTEGKNTANSVW